jgi:peptide-methionine (S)-S-oxide reductase
MVEAANALPGREREIDVPALHEVLGTPLKGPFPEGFQQAVFGMGCFWGEEKVFWEAPGIYTTAVGYAGGFTPNPTYEEVCSGATSYEQLLKLFWEGHDPTQGMRQGNDVGSQYRSAIYWQDEAQHAAAEASRDAYQQVLTAAGHGKITTEIEPGAPTHPFYYAEDYHQQYLAKNPAGYCGVSCPVGLTSS